jgi:hypothetical protein
MLLADATLAERLGHAGPERVRDISWSHVVQSLVR